MYKRQLDEGLVGIWKLSFDKPMPLDIPNQEKPIYGTIFNYRKNGTEFWNKFNLVPIKDRNTV